VSAVSVAELRAAWHAVESGAFAGRPDAVAAATPLAYRTVWTPDADERVLVVVGCAGSVGASTVALAIATAAEVPSRVVECCPPLASGFVGAASAELGEVDGWRRGSRGPVLVERRLHVDPTVPPASTTAQLTILDAGPSALRPEATGWLADMVASRPPLVVVTRATIPGLRRLESCLTWVADSHDVVVVAVGPPVKRWPRQVRHSLGSVSRDLLEVGRMLTFPDDRLLTLTGLTPDPLPSRLLRAGADVLTSLRKEP
jgi:hypothetical protein